MSSAFKLRTPEYTLVSGGSTAAATLASAQTVHTAWSWNQQLAITVVLFVLLRFRGVAFKTETFVATPAEELVDYPDVLFSSRDELPSALSVDERPYIASFGFDLGGSTCACLLHWDVKQYWQQVP